MGKAFGAVELMLLAVPAFCSACPWQARGERRVSLADDSILQESPAIKLDTVLGPWEPGTGSWHCVSAVPFLSGAGDVPDQYEKQK